MSGGLETGHILEQGRLSSKLRLVFGDGFPGIGDPQQQGVHSVAISAQETHRTVTNLPTLIDMDRLPSA